ncbi:MAG: hypothetical protein OXG25_05325 [Gammaproteobacteria bacterium]|nr:hypothetical protein [Gammaproteobacteria bacterium]
MRVSHGLIKLTPQSQTMKTYGYYIGRIILRLSELKVHIRVPMSDGWNSERHVWRDDLENLRNRFSRADFDSDESINLTIRDFEQLETWVRDALRSGPPSFVEGLHLRDLLNEFSSIAKELKSRRRRGRLKASPERRRL